MSANKDALDNVLSLSMQLNRQAFAHPPVEGWLASFLSSCYERFASDTFHGLQVVQVIGNAAVQMTRAGDLPASAADQYTLENTSPIAIALRTRQMVATADMRVFPLVPGDNAIGALIVYATQLDAGMEQAISTLALQLGVAVSQQVKPATMQTGRLTRQVDMMRSLAETARTVGSVSEGTEALNRGAKSLVEALHVDHVSIAAFDYETDKADMVAEYPDHGFAGMKLELHGSPVNERLISERKPIIIPNVAEAPELGNNQPALQKLGLKSMVILPMLAENELIGSIGLESFYEDRKLTADEMEGALAITSQLAISVRNMRLYDSMKRRATQLEQITDLSRRVMSTFDRAEIFTFIREETQSLLDSEYFSVALLENDTSRLRLFVLNGVPSNSVEFELDKTALRLIIMGGEPLVMDDIGGSDFPDYKLLAQTGMHAALIVPLIVGGRTIGTYNVGHSQVARYSSIDLAVLEQVGNQLAIALENARIYAQTAQRADVERLMNRTGGNIQQGGDMQSILLNTLQQVAQALNAKRARVRLEMPGVVSIQQNAGKPSSSPSKKEA